MPPQNLQMIDRTRLVAFFEALIAYEPANRIDAMIETAVPDATPVRDAVVPARRAYAEYLLDRLLRPVPYA